MSVSTQSQSGANFGSPLLRRSSLFVLTLMLVSACFSSGAFAGCHAVQSSNIVQAGLNIHDGQYAVGKKPIAEGVWWYSGPVEVVYEAGVLKYFPVLEDVDCRGPGCRRKPANSSVEIVATVNGRSVDVGNRSTCSHRLSAAPSTPLTRAPLAFWAAPLPASILRPPCVSV